MKKIPPVTDKKSLAAMLLEIESELLVEIPRAVKRAKIREVCYGLLVCYIDLSTDEYEPVFCALPEAHRAKKMADNDVGLIWNLPEVPSLSIGYQPSKTLSMRCQAVYDYLTTDWDGPDELVAILPFRKMIYRVCLALNEMDWQKHLPVTDDFVVMASDWSTAVDIQADGNASVPLAKKKALRDRGLFFNPQKFKPVKIPTGNKIGQAKKLPPTEQIPYWLGQLELLAAGADCDAAQANWGAKRLVAQLIPLGTQCSEAVLKFLEQECQRSEWRNDNNRTDESEVTVRAEVLKQVMSELGKLVAPVKDTERRLWKLFEAVIKRNKPHKLWSNIPGSLAFAIQDVFPAYRYWVIRGDENRIESLAEIRKAAKQGIGLSD